LSVAIAYPEGSVTRHAACVGVPEEHDESAFAKTLDERRAVRFLHGNGLREILLGRVCWHG
jgi:hypothetical protein